MVNEREREKIATMQQLMILIDLNFFRFNEKKSSLISKLQTHLSNPK